MSDFIIIGGGVLGMLSARELAMAGARVTLLERGEMGRESSWAGGGIVSPLYPWRYADSVTALAGWSQQHYPALSDELIATTGIDPELTACGLLIVAPDEEQQAQRWAQDKDQNLQLIDRDTLHTLEPALAQPGNSAIWLPQVANLRNPRLAQALEADIVKRGVTLHTQTEVTGFIEQGGKIGGVDTDKGSFRAEAVVVCAGAWTAKLLGALPQPPAIHPLRGQMLLFRTPPGTISRMVLEENRYIIPRRDGRVLFGSTLEETGFDKSTTAEARTELYQIATRRFPVLAEHELELHWAGLRPCAPEGIPYIGPHPELENLFINAGHFRNGIVLGPASARLLADLLLGREHTLPARPYALDATRA